LTGACSRGGGKGRGFWGLCQGGLGGCRKENIREQEREGFWLGCAKGVLFSLGGDYGGTGWETGGEHSMGVVNTVSMFV